ncbi:hypothetical protein QBC38DRAFT_160182 [Podospora fimiseda]|uniref:Uncharacterized protein n=1 Tax=Podospora fimiseda TaxID=252190 RepID=A0AAN7BS02_9PEZI|nr:hypothetical protein QBC38DRAFT_160182 [Podospora fimiseda]
MSLLFTYMQLFIKSDATTQCRDASTTNFILFIIRATLTPHSISAGLLMRHRKIQIPPTTNTTMPSMFPPVCFDVPVPDFDTHFSVMRRSHNPFYTASTFFFFPWLCMSQTYNAGTQFAVEPRLEFPKRKEGACETLILDQLFSMRITMPISKKKVQTLLTFDLCGVQLETHTPPPVHVCVCRETPSVGDQVRITHTFTQSRFCTL